MGNVLRPQLDYKNKGLKKLTAGESYEGNICFILVGYNTEFPNNATDCMTERGGVNLSGYLSEFPMHLIPCQFTKIKITAGNVFLGID